jgi:hypothetical protein
MALVSVDETDCGFGVETCHLERALGCDIMGIGAINEQYIRK